jgi:hypothetical protein
MRHVDVEALVQVIPIAFTREQKLRRWADLCRRSEPHLNLGHNLEYTDPHTLRNTPATYLGHSAMAVAVGDPTFNEQGLAQTASIKDVMNFFEISKQQLHEFSCDCGGGITNEEQARRIERLV